VLIEKAFQSAGAVDSLFTAPARRNELHFAIAIGQLRILFLEILNKEVYLRFSPFRDGVAQEKDHILDLQEIRLGVRSARCASH
jgi:hypothetical protein